MTWLTHRVIRKEASFKLVPNEWFNLETKTGIRGWNSPKFVISVNKYLSTYGAVDARCEIVASTYPTFYLSNVDRMGAGSEITVYVIEGNENTINYNLNAGWTDTFRIKENTIYQYEINSSNNWTTAIPNNLIGKEFDILYLPKKVYFSKLTFQYEYQAINNGNNTMSFKLRETKGTIQSETWFPGGSDYHNVVRSVTNNIYFYTQMGVTGYSYHAGPSSTIITSTINGVTISNTVIVPTYTEYGGPSFALTSGFTPPRISTDRTVKLQVNGDRTFAHVIYATTNSSQSSYSQDFKAIVVFIKK